jgi:hypothetical protein
MTLPGGRSALSTADRYWRRLGRVVHTGNDPFLGRKGSIWVGIMRGEGSKGGVQK